MTFYHYYQRCQTIVWIVNLQVIERTIGWKLAITKKELRSILISKLKSLSIDFNVAPDTTAAFLSEVKKTREEKRKAMMALYAEYYAPQKVTDYSGLPKRQSDMTAEMIDFSNGFDRYIASIEAEYNSVIKQKRDAAALLSLVLSLEQPYSRILYLRYYKKMSPDDVCSTLHIARSTMFRKRNAALGELVELFADKNNIQLKRDC